MSESRSGSTGTIVLAFLAGAAAGAVVALLTSPKTGREMRASISEWARLSGVGDAVARAARTAREALDEISEG